MKENELTRRERICQSCLEYIEGHPQIQDDCKAKQDPGLAEYCNFYKVSNE